MSVKIYSTEQRRMADSETISRKQITSLELMEKAGKACANWICNKFSRARPIHIFCGKGNNGGDGWVIARILAECDYKVSVYHLFPVESFSSDAKENYLRCLNNSNIAIHFIRNVRELPLFFEDDIIIDAILGSGLNQKISGHVAEVIEYLNSSVVTRIAIDIPSGLKGEEIPAEESTIFKADFTITFQFPYLSFLYAESAPYVGEWYMKDIGIVSQQPVKYFYIESNDIVLKKYSKFTYKNQKGHALLIAGSKGMIGAAILSAKSCLRTGCGLVTVHSPSHYASIIHSVLPEALVSFDEGENFITSLPELSLYKAIGIGPGLGQSDETFSCIRKLFDKATCPLVLDADALNILSKNKEWLTLLPPNTILTPHPGEFSRLFGNTNNSKERLEIQILMAQKYQIIIILKGHHTSIALPDGTCFFNSTGNSGMATAGSGDVLTGIIVSLLAQGYAPSQAAIYGVYLHGLAGDIAAQTNGLESLIASDIINAIGNAIAKVEKS